MRGRTRRHVSPIDRAEAVLAGRRRPTVVELMELIHEVNPTRRALPPREERQRYQVKNRLQALLIRRFPDELRIEPAPPGSPDVGLKHRYSGLDACHVRVVDLEPDARSWVLRQIDLGETAPELPPAPLEEPQDEPESLPGLLRSAREAIGSYDYPLAEERLRLALQRSEGGVVAAAALLELLVDTLARDSDALALVPALSREAKAQPSVRALLALAAARAGDEAAAIDWLGGADGAQCADAWAQLAALALGRDDLVAAQDALDRLRELDPVHPRLVEVSDALEARRRELERPLAEQRRREKEAQEAQRRAQVEALIAQAREYERAGDDEAALRAWEDAAALGGECAQQAVATRERLRERAQRAQVERVAAGLADLGADALEDYGLLPEAGRAQVRARVSLPHLGWMEEMYASESGAKARAGAEASLAFAEARLRLEAGRFDEVLSMLAPHMRLLSHVPEAKRTQAQAREAANQEAERRRAQEAEVRAREEAAERDWQRAADRDRLRAESDSHAAGGRWLEAVRSAELALRIEHDEARREGLRERMQRATRAQRDAWGFRQWDGPLPTSLLRTMGLGVGYGSRDICAPVLAPDGRSLVVAVVHERTLLLAELALDASHLKRVCRLRLPETLVLSVSAARSSSLVFVDRLGLVLELGWPDCGVLRWEDARTLPGLEAVEPVELASVPDSSWLWLSGQVQRGWGTWLVDPTTHQVLRRDQNPSWLATVREEDEWLTAVLETGGRRIQWRRGDELLDDRGVAGMKMLGIRPWTSDAGAVVLSGHQRPAKDRRLVLSTPRRPERGEWPIDGTEELDRPALATDPQQGLIALLLSPESDRNARSLWLLEWSGERPVLLGTRPVSSVARFAHGSLGGGAVLVDSLGDAPRIWPLQRKLPDWPQQPEPPSTLPRALRALVPSPPCMPHLVGSQSAQQKLDSSLVSVSNVRALLTVTRRQVDGRSAALYYDVLLRLQRFDEAYDLLMWAKEQCPDSSDLGLRLAELLVRERMWEKARECLESLSVDALLDLHRRHAIHLRALVYMHLGELQKAREALGSASDEDGGTCALDAVGEMLDVLEGGAPPDASGGTPTMAAQWSRHMRALDEALLGRGSIRALLDEPAAWDIEEAQLLARLAEGAWRTASTPAEELRLEIAAWRFIGLQWVELPERWELPLEAAWPAEAMDELAERLLEWLSLPSATG